MTTELIQPPTVASRILIIDDDALCVRQLVYFFEKDNYSLCLGMTDPVQALAELAEIKPDLIILDWHMETMGGSEVLAALHAFYPVETRPPVVVLTGDASHQTRDEALAAGVADFLTKPLDQTEACLRVRNLLRTRHLVQEVQAQKQNLEVIVGQRTAALRRKVNELRQANQQIMDSERMRALGLMAGGIAHDFNNALTIVRGYSDLYTLEPHTWSQEEITQAFGCISLAAADAAEIVRRLREFHRPFSSQEEERQPTDLNALITEAIALSKPKWETQTRAEGICITLDTEFQPLPKLTLAAPEIREVLINLLFNAVDAMPQGGRILLRTREENGEYLLEIQDSGTGMTEETRRRCLEPFYTTKGDRGTGLGLSIVYGILQRHGGSIRIDSQLNEGTTLTVVLPRTLLAGATAEPDPLTIGGRPLSILFVDDDAEIRDIIQRLLETDGHRVVVAANGCEGLEKFGLEKFDLVITDQVMPKMSGDQLATAIRGLHPANPIILLTGYAQRRAPDDVDEMIFKPVSFDTLRGAIGRAILPAD